MRYRLTTARLLVATYGPSFDPLRRPSPPSVLAENLTMARTIASSLEHSQKTWRSDDVPDATMATDQARDEVGVALSQDLQSDCRLEALANTYKPIYDSSGTQVGHDTIAWLMVEGTALIQEFPGGGGKLELGAVACIFLSVVPE